MIGTANVQEAPGAKVALGLKRRLTPQQFRQAIDDGSISDLIGWQTARVGDAHAAEHDVIAVAELVNVEAEAGAHVAQSGKLGGFRTREILVGRKFHVSRLTLECRHRQAGPFGERSVVGEILLASCFRTSMRLEQGRK